VLRRLYTLLLAAAVPVLLRRDVRSSGRGWRAVGRERTGRGTPRARVWIHAASLGEAAAARALAETLARARGDLPILVTSFTPGGYARLRALLPGTIAVRLAPYDCPSAVRRVLREGGVRVLVLVETELWPNLLAQAAHAGIPVVVASGRLGPCTLRRRRLLRALLPDPAHLFALVAAQSRADARRFRFLGVPASRVVVAGNLKAEAAGPPDRLAFRPAWEKRIPTAPVWVAGSTHEGEETIVLAAHRRLLATLPRTVLVLAPRHPRRVPAVRAEALRAGFDPVLWSEERAVPPGGVLILDGLGLLPSCYARAGLVFVGGSLVPRGGHDPLEAARVGRPVLIGPYHAHCRDAVLGLGSAGALAVVADGEELVSRLTTLLPDRVARARMGRRGALEVRRRRGSVLAAVLPPILDLLGSGPADPAPLRGGGSG
jgi:3-deoxy-D-manno-octulosonic-acid transferase